MNKRTFILVFCIFISIITILSGCAVNDNQQPNDPEEQQDETIPNGTDGNGENGGDRENNGEPTPTIDEPGFESGMYKIGQDMPAGEYKLYSTEGLSGVSYFEIAKDSSNTIESIIANDNFYSFTYVTLAEGQYFKLTDARAVPVNDAAVSDPENGKYSSGMYKVGFDIPAGEYKVFPEEDSTLGYGYYEITSNSAHVLDSIIANDNFEDPRYITLKEGQYVKLNEAYIEAKWDNMITQ